MITLQEALKRADNILNKRAPDWKVDYIYLIHHMHPPKRAEDMEELHHCFLFEKKRLKGNKFTQKHVKDGKKFRHALDIKDLTLAPEAVYDHLNNKFSIGVKTIKDIKYACITGII